MAVCLDCGCRRARVIYSRTMRAADGKRECWRIVQCPMPHPDGGGRRRQTIHDEGPTTKGRIERQHSEKPRMPRR